MLRPLCPGTHRNEGRVSPRADLDDVEKRKFLTLLGLELRPIYIYIYIYRLDSTGSEHEQWQTVVNEVMNLLVP
jgi:hypothetical protein